MRSAFRLSKAFLFNNWVFFFPLIVSILAGFLLFIYSKQAPNLNKVLHSSLSFRDAAPWGQLGDFFGGILNPIISLFTLLIATMVWKLQKTELIETRTAIQRQTFDQLFLGMLEAQRSMTGQVAFIDDKTGESLHVGKRAIDSYLKVVVNKEGDEFFSHINRGDENLSMDTIKDLIIKTFSVRRFSSIEVIPYIACFCTRYYGRNLVVGRTTLEYISNSITFEQAFGHIYRSTYQILKLIESEFSLHNISDQKVNNEYQQLKRRYVNLLRAQMSESEFIFFALSAITKDGEKSWARAVRLNFFEDRLQNQEWTKSLSELFVQSEHNLAEADKILENE